LIQLDVNEIKQKYESTFRKFQHLDRIEFKLETISRAFIELISSLFPQIKSFKIEIICLKVEWNENKLQSIKKYFGPKLEYLVIKKVWPFSLGGVLKLLETENLRDIELIDCILDLMDEENMFNLPKNIKSFAIIDKVHYVDINCITDFNDKYSKSLTEFWVNIREDVDNNEIQNLICEKSSNLKRTSDY
jgi:hypothetical protein